MSPDSGATLPAAQLTRSNVPTSKALLAGSTRQPLGLRPALLRVRDERRSQKRSLSGRHCSGTAGVSQTNLGLPSAPRGRAGWCSVDRSDSRLVGRSGCGCRSRSVTGSDPAAPNFRFARRASKCSSAGLGIGTTASSPESVSPDSMRAHASSPRPCESGTRCTGLDTDRPGTTRRQFGLTNVYCQSRLTAMNAEDIASAIASNDPSLGSAPL